MTSWCPAMYNCKLWNVCSTKILKESTVPTSEYLSGTQSYDESQLSTHDVECEQ